MREELISAAVGFLIGLVFAWIRERRLHVPTMIRLEWQRPDGSIRKETRSYPEIPGLQLGDMHLGENGYEMLLKMNEFWSEQYARDLPDEPLT